MKNKLLIIALILLLIMSLFVVTVSAEDDTPLQDTYTAEDESVSASFWVWFLCAFAVLKIGQRLDNLLMQLGVNVGRTGGDMLAEVIALGRSAASTGRNAAHSFSSNAGTGAAKIANTAGNVANNLSGMVSRAGMTSTMSAVTQNSNVESYAQSAFSNSVNSNAQNTISQTQNKRLQDNFVKNITNGDKQAISIAGQIANGYANGAMEGSVGQCAFEGYFKSAIANARNGIPEEAAFSDISMGGGQIHGRMNGAEFAMYSKERYMAPQGDFEVVKAEDGSEWYKQDAVPTVEKTPYLGENGKIEYNQKIVDRVPRPPQKRNV